MKILFGVIGPTFRSEGWESRSKRLFFKAPLFRANFLAVTERLFHFHLSCCFDAKILSEQQTVPSAPLLHACPDGSPALRLRGHRVYFHTDIPWPTDSVWQAWQVFTQLPLVSTCPQLGLHGDVWGDQRLAHNQVLWMKSLKRKKKNNKCSWN